MKNYSLSLTKDEPDQEVGLMMTVMLGWKEEKRLHDRL